MRFSATWSLRTHFISGAAKKRATRFLRNKHRGICRSSCLRQHFVAIEQDFAQSGPFLIEHAFSGGAHGFEQITGLTQTRNVDVVSACVEKLTRLRKHISGGDDFCSWVQFAQETDQPRVRGALEQRIVEMSTSALSTPAWTSVSRCETSP